MKKGSGGTRPGIRTAGVPACLFRRTLCLYITSTYTPSLSG